MALQHLRSSTTNKRPTPAAMSDGQLAMNTNSASPGLFLKDSSGALVKVGPVHVGTTAPNASPASGGATGNTVGEQWLDTSSSTYVFKIWDGSAWRSEAGEFVNASGDVMTGALGIIAGTAGSPGLYVSGDTNTGIYSPGADQLALATNGTGRLFVNSLGQVSIGTSSPSIIYRATINGDGATYVGGLSLRNNGTESLTIGNVGATDADNSEIWNPRSGYLRFATNNTERLRITSAGLVGVGTSSPSTLLEIKQDQDANTRLRITNATNGSSATAGIHLGPYGGNWYLEALASATFTNPLRFTFDGTERFRFTYDGKLGIGTTTVNTTLEVQNASTPIIRVGDGTRHMELRGGSTGQNAAVGTNYAGGFDIIQNGSAAVTIDSSKRVLVGTSSARSMGGIAAGLFVEGTAYNSLSLNNNTNDAWASLIAFGKSRGTTTGSKTSVSSGDRLGGVNFYGADGTNDVHAAGILAEVDGTPGTNDMPGRLVFSTTADGASSPTERVRIGSDGLSAFFATNVLYALSTSAAGTTNVLFLGRYGSTVGSTASGTNSIIIWTNGNVINTNNSYGAISDIKLKENIVDANSQWDDLKALQVRNYNFKEGQIHTQIGLIAQEVELISPGLVTESPDRDEEGNDLGTVTKSVNYSVLYMKAVKALQEAMERIETLEAKVAALEAS